MNDVYFSFCFCSSFAGGRSIVPPLVGCSTFPAMPSTCRCDKDRKNQKRLESKRKGPLSAVARSPLRFGVLATRRRFPPAATRRSERKCGPGRRGELRDVSRKGKARTCSRTPKPLAIGSRVKRTLLPTGAAGGGSAACALQATQRWQPQPTWARLSQLDSSVIQIQGINLALGSC